MTSSSKSTSNFAGTILCLAVITYLSLRDMSNIEPPIQFAGMDKVVHGLMYAILAWIWKRDLWKGRSQKETKKNIHTLLYIVVPCTLYGGLMELLQEWYFYPRTGDWYDFLADFIGSLLGWAIL